MAARRILHVFSTLNVGGPQVRFATLANRLGDGYRHLLFAMDGQYASTALFEPAAPCEIYRGDIAGGNLLRTVSSIRSALNALRPDLLVTYNWGAIEWAVANMRRGCPHIHIVDGFGPEEADRQLPRRVWFRRIALSGGTTVVVPSLTLQKIVTEIWRIAPRRVRYIPNGIDCDAFAAGRNAQLAEKYALSGETPVIGTVAGLRPEKNLSRLIDAFRTVANSCPAPRLLIVGDGPERFALQNKAAAAGIEGRVTFAGYLSGPAEILGLFDIFALSSDTEQMPISVLEAMASGLPVAAVDVGDVRHIVSDANEPFIVKRDADDLGAAFAALLADKDLRNRTGEANRAHVRAVYSETDMVDAYKQLFSSANRTE